MSDQTIGVAGHGNAFGPIIVAVPTYRRPDLLSKLLGDILPELKASTATLIIADNDCDSAIESLVREYATRWPATFYVPVRDRGLAQVRNAIIATACQSVPDWRWLAMLDDDGRVSPGWLTTLLACGAKHSGHLVGGPVEGVLPNGCSRFAKVSVFAARRRWPSGLTETLNTTQNLAISRDLLSLLQLPLFSSTWDLSGGEDYELFRRTTNAGGRLVWCDEAVVWEPAPAQRLTIPALLKRYWTTGAYMAVIDADFDGKSSTWFSAFKGLLGCFARMAWALSRFNWDETARQTLAIGHYAGRIAGLLGWRSARYLTPLQPEKNL